MTRDTTSRKETVLRIVVDEYITTAAPVASESIIRRHRLGVSSATIRNDMARLEEEGYIIRPHTSAGSIPMDKGYRHYVQSLTDDIELPQTVKEQIRTSFYDVAEALDRWLDLATDIVARLVGNAALVTFPRAKKCQFMHIDLLALHEFLSLFVLIINETVLKRHLLSFTNPIDQERLNAIANKLNAAFSGLNSTEIISTKLDLSDDEKKVVQAALDVMHAEDMIGHDEAHLKGLREMLGQPEFVQKEKMLDIMELVEAKSWLNAISSESQSDERVQVLIGEECQDETLKDLSLVFSRYGIPDKTGGTIGVIGPTRMDYRRAMSTVDYVSRILSDLLAGICRGN